MRLFKLILLVSVLVSISSYAQDIPVRLKLTTTKNEPVPFATVTVRSIADSSFVQQQQTDSSGIAAFSLQQNETYNISFSAIGFASLNEKLKITGTAQQYIFITEPTGKSLANVVVTSKRPIMRQEDDKTIVDPENLAASSTNAFEIMEKTPGLFVDQDGNIYLNSTTPATVHINGREQKMSAADIATMLKSLPPNAIATIEILRTPSARYDASGGGGVVNVILKKGVKIGLTGSINTGFNQGKFGNRFFGVNLSNSNGKLSTYLNLNYNNRNNLEEVTSQRLFVADSVLQQNAETRYKANGYYSGFGLSYSFNKKWELAYDGRLGINQSRNSSINLSQVKKLSTDQASESNQADVWNKINNLNTAQSISLKYKIDSLGSEWTTDLSYTLTPNKTWQDYATTFFSNGGGKFTGSGDIDNRLHFLSAQTNYIKRFPQKLTVETGIKSTNVWFTNATDYFRNSNGSPTVDNIRSGAYKYEENINAAYLQASKTISKITVKAGSRLEHTQMKGDQQLPKDTSFLLRRTDLFPYVFISRPLMKIAGYDLRGYLVYRRTINRPAYEFLNPSIRYIDPYLFETGNPSLRPQFTNNYEANISFEERPVLAVGYNDTKDIFTNVVYPTDTNNKRSFRTYDNLGTNKETYFRALGALPPGGRYFFVAGLQYNRNFYEGLYENKPLSFKRGSWTIFTYQTFKISELTNLSLNGFIRMNGQMQFYELSNFGALRMSLTQQFLNKKLTATISGEDLFATNKYDFTINQGSINAAGLRKNDTRRFGLNLRYNFGLRKKEENNLFNVDSPEKVN